MNKTTFEQKIKLIQLKSRITLAMAEAVTTPTSPTIHNLWKSAGELDCMVTALKEEMAGNPPPKIG